jgi:excisionase family DNA binding protein
MQASNAINPHDPSLDGSLHQSRTGEQPAPFLTKAQLAGLLRCSERHIDNLRRRGLLPVINLGRSVRFRHEAVLTAIKKLEGGQAV